MMHGGFITLLLDEASSKVLSILGKRGVTRSIEVSFEKPVTLERRIHLIAELESQSGRKHWIDAKIINEKDEVLASSRALFLAFSRRD